jgi:hypothetical protein
MTDAPTTLPSRYRVGEGDIHFNALIYSDPGVGKTTLAAQATDHDDMGPVLFLNVEGGLLSVDGEVDAMDVDSVNELEAVFWELNKGEKGSLGDIRTVVIDSGSELQAVNLEDIVESEVEAALIDPKSSRTNRDDIWLEDYKTSSTQLRRLFRWYRDLPMNVIITALSRTEYPKGTQRQRNVDLSLVDPTVVKPQFTKALCESVMGFVDFVWYLYQEADEEGEIQRWLLTQRDDPFRAKTRGARFRQMLGRDVLLQNMDIDGHEGHTLPSIYDLLLESKRG